MLQFTPGDPVQAMVGQYPVPPDFRAAIVRQYRLDDPLPARLLQYFVNAAARRSRLFLPAAGFGRASHRAARTAHLAARGLGLRHRRTARHRNWLALRHEPRAPCRPVLDHDRARRLRDPELLARPVAGHLLRHAARLVSDPGHGAALLARARVRRRAGTRALSGAAGDHLCGARGDPRRAAHAGQHDRDAGRRATSSRRVRKGCRARRSSAGTCCAIRACRCSR